MTPDEKMKYLKNKIKEIYTVKDLHDIGAGCLDCGASHDKERIDKLKEVVIFIGLAPTEIEKEVTIISRGENYPYPYNFFGQGSRSCVFVSHFLTAAANLLIGYQEELKKLQARVEELSRLE